MPTRPEVEAFLDEAIENDRGMFWRFDSKKAAQSARFTIYSVRKQIKKLTCASLADPNAETPYDELVFTVEERNGNWGIVATRAQIDRSRFEPL